MPAFEPSALQRETFVLLRAVNYKYNELPLLLHAGVCMQESGLNPDAVGDNGQSFGLHQIYLPAHPEVTGYVACSPWYDFGYVEVRQRWLATWQTNSFAQRWADPANRPGILEAFAPAAQGSIAWPAGLGAQRYAEVVYLAELCS